MNIVRKKEGITLVALVITIILLLILAGISITALTGRKGLFAQASEATIQTEIARNRRTSQFNICRISDGKIPRRYRCYIYGRYSK